MSKTVVDAVDLERKVKDMYTQVALDPHGQFHFEMGRAMAHRLGYSDAELDAAPPASINRSLVSATTSIWLTLSTCKWWRSGRRSDVGGFTFRS